MDVHSEERVPCSHLPQLATRIQCWADHVYLADGMYIVWRIFANLLVSCLDVMRHGHEPSLEIRNLPAEDPGELDVHCPLVGLSLTRSCT